MSDIYIKDLYGDCGLATNAKPRVFSGVFSPEEMSLCYIVITVSTVSAGINAGTPAVILWQTSLDKGATWRTIDGVVAEPITSTGIFTAKLTADTTILGPICRVTVTPPAGQSCVIAKAEKSRISDLAVFRGGAGGGGGATGTLVAVGGGAQYVSAAPLSGQAVAAHLIGFDGVTHREIKLTTAGAIEVEGGGGAASSIITTLRRKYSANPVTTGAWVVLIASTTAALSGVEIFDSSGETLELGVGALGAEVHVAYVPPGGLSAPVIIPLGSRVILRAVSANATVGEHLFQGVG